MSNEIGALVITPRALQVAIMPAERDVVLRLDLDPAQTGLTVDVAVRMTPTEARRLAALISRKADEAEAGLPRA